MFSLAKNLIPILLFTF